MAWLLFECGKNCTSVHLGSALTFIQELCRGIRKGEVRVSSVILKRELIYTTKSFLG